MERKPYWLYSINLDYDIEVSVAGLLQDYSKSNGQIPVDYLALVRLWKEQSGEKIYIRYSQFAHPVGTISPFPERKQISPDENPFLMIISRDLPAAEQRLTIAHELAHRIVPRLRYDRKTTEFYCDLIAMRLLCPDIEKVLRKNIAHYRAQGELPLEGIRQRTLEGKTLLTTATDFQVPLRDLIQFLKLLYPGLRLKEIIVQFA